MTRPPCHCPPTSTTHIDEATWTACIDAGQHHFNHPRRPPDFNHLHQQPNFNHLHRQTNLNHPHQWPTTPLWPPALTIHTDNHHVSQQPTHHFPHPLFDKGKFYKCSRGAFMYMVYLLSINSAYCLQDQSQTGYQLVWTTTGPDRSRNCKRPTKTALNWLTLVQSSFSWSVNLWRPVLVPVFWNLDKRPDWTGLPSTIQNWPRYGWKCKILLKIVDVPDLFYRNTNS